MGSRMMHLIIANQVCKLLEISNQQLFLLGGIAPDATFTRNSKNKSHYYEGRLDDGTRFANYHAFIEKYHSEIRNDFMLGYITHLVSDDVWMKSIYFKNNLKNRLDADPNLLERWHNDFRILNGKLVEWFDCGDLKNKLVGTNMQINNEFEINSSDLNTFKEETLNDFTYNKADIEKELQVYNLSEIIDYIELATTSAFTVCSAIKNENLE